MQIIHWFTSSALVKSPETTVLLDSLFVRPSQPVLTHNKIQRFHTYSYSLVGGRC